MLKEIVMSLKYDFFIVFYGRIRIIIYVLNFIFWVYLGGGVKVC